jgi:hypothetical protein
MAPDPCADLAVTPKTSAKDEASCSVAPPTPPKVTPDEVRAVARKFADQPIQETEPDVWAVLTAISKKARLRPQVPAPLPRPPLNPNPKTQALPIFLSFFVFAWILVRCILRMNNAWVEASILLFTAETFVELPGLLSWALLLVNVDAGLLNLLWFHQLLNLNVLSFFVFGKKVQISSVANCHYHVSVHGLLLVLWAWVC